jgi:hypothetical protein
MKPDPELVAYWVKLGRMKLSPYPDEHRELSTLMYVASHLMEFALTPEIWPVFLAWEHAHHDYSRQLCGRQDDARREMHDMYHLAASIALAELLPDDPDLAGDG